MIALVVLGLLVSHAMPVKVVASPAVGLAGHAICVTVIVAAHPDNRLLGTTIDCENYFRSWQEQLDGDRAIYSRRHCFEPMPQGQCVIGADLFRVDPKAKGGVAHFADRARACFAGDDVAC